MTDVNAVTAVTAVTEEKKEKTMPTRVYKAAWVEVKNDKEEQFKEFKRVKQRYLAIDKQGQLVYLSDSKFSLEMTIQKYPDINFHLTSEF